MVAGWRETPSSGVKGLTVLEVLLAIVILSLVSVVVWRFVSAGDILFGRNMLIENAAQVAQNAVEALKAQAPYSESIEEREYEASMGGRTFYIAQKVQDAGVIDTLISDYPVKAITLEIYEKNDDDYYYEDAAPLISFEYIQGYAVK